MTPQHIRVIPVLQSENEYYLCFTGLVKDADLDAATRTYIDRYGAPPAVIQYNEVAKLYELGPVPVNS